MKSKKIVLIASPWIFKKTVEFVSQNLWAGYLASHIKKFSCHQIYFIDPLIEGFDQKKLLSTKYLDVYRFGLSDEEIVRRIPPDADIIGINAPFTDSRLVLFPLLKAIKEAFLEVPLVLGGIWPSTLPDEAILSCADILVLGEGEKPFLEIANGTPLKDIGGLVYKDGNRIIKTGKGKILTKEELDRPDYEIRPMKEYLKWSPRGEKELRTLSMITSRGCPNDCNFCSISVIYKKYLCRSANNVLSEIKWAIKEYCIEHIEFEDDNLTSNRKRTIKIFKGLREIRKKHGITWSAPNGIQISTLNREAIKLIKESGCTLLYIAVESGDPEILRLMNKPVWLEKAPPNRSSVLQVVRWCAEEKIPTSAFIMVAYPGEDKKSFKKTLQFCDKLIGLGINAITPLVATPYPGTKLYWLCEQNNWLVRPDSENTLVLAVYSDYSNEYVNIQTPKCSKEDAFERYEIMKERYPLKYNKNVNIN